MHQTQGIFMRPSKALNLHREEIRQIVSQYHAENPRVFGSVLDGSDRNDSDLDLLVDPTSETTMMDIAKIQRKLQLLLGVSVDILTPKSLPALYRKTILEKAKPV